MTVRFDIYRGAPVDFGAMPPVVTIVGYPPKPGEGSRDYMNRVQAEVLCDAFAPKPGIWSRIRSAITGRT